MKKLRLFPRFLVSIGILVILSAGLVASAETQTINLNYGNVMTWSFTGSTVTFNSIVPGVAQLSSSTAASYTVSANVPWKITLYGTDFVDASNKTIPISNLSYRFGTTGNFTPIPSVATMIDTNTTTQSVKYIQYQLLVPAGSSYTPGSYSGSLTYSFSAA